MTRRPRLLAIDLDGTMLRSDGSLSARVIRALAEAVAAGIHVVPATGRPVIVAADVVAASQLDQYWVFGNGAVTRHIERDELVRGFWMDRSVSLTLVDRIRAQVPAARFAVEFESTLAYEPGFESVVPIPPPVGPTDDLSAAIAEHDGEVQKVLVFDNSVTIAELLGVVGQASTGLAVPSYSGLPFVELAAHNVTKATALAHLADDLGIPATDTVAVGDNFNDLAMLEWAGIGYAMGNAPHDVLETADEVLPSNDADGVAHLIDELLA